MNMLATNVGPLAFTEASIFQDAASWFSAYGFGWGYCAFSLPVSTVCEELGAADATPGQLKLAFELGRKRISGAVGHVEIPRTGDRVTLDDLAP
ncbi:hypothetical protein [Caballeronia sp. DA-9]|uniref:hypothetical protein n=1 Tax=Caballeronia sp. DA-9 TaxID=3436237 RepID=UPI003F677BE5